MNRPVPDNTTQVTVHPTPGTSSKKKAVSRPPNGEQPLIDQFKELAQESLDKIEVLKKKKVKDPQELVQIAEEIERLTYTAESCLEGVEEQRNLSPTPKKTPKPLATSSPLPTRTILARYRPKGIGSHLGTILRPVKVTKIPLHAPPEK